MYLRITNTDIALDMCALMLLDEIAAMNKDDPRNAEYLAQEGFMAIEDRIKSLSNLARLFPL